MKAVGPKGDRPRGPRGEILELLEDRVGFAVECQGGVIRQHGVSGHLGGEQIGIDRAGLGHHTRRDHHIEPSTYAQDMPLLLVVSQ